MPANFGEACRVDRACVSQETKAQKVKAEITSRSPTLTWGKNIVDQADKIQGPSCKKKKSARPGHDKADGKISHFGLRSLGFLALVSFIVDIISSFPQDASTAALRLAIYARTAWDWLPLATRRFILKVIRKDMIACRSTKMGIPDRMGFRYRCPSVPSE